MVLDGIANHPDLLIETEPLVDPVSLIKDDLYAFNRVLIPDTAYDVIVETHDEQVLHELLAQVVVDPEYLLVFKGGFKDPVIADSGFKVKAKGLLHHNLLGQGTDTVHG